MLDTHFVVWMTNNPNLLKPRERAEIAMPGRTLILSAISIWELRIKWQALDRTGKRKGIVSPNEAMAFAAESNISVIAPAVDNYAATLAQPLKIPDPFDEMLLVHAQQLGARLLTRNRKLAAHPLSLPL